MYPVGFVIMFNESLRQKYLWTTSIYLFVQALFSTIILIEAAGKKLSFISVSLIFLFSLLIETVGVITGYPFGNYRYTDTLQPLLFSTVPIAIGFAWITLSVNSFLIVKYFLRNRNTFLLIILSGALIAYIDILLEPFASFVNNYWIWRNGNIPIQNYLSWFFIGMMFSFILNKFLDKISVKILFPSVILSLSVLQFFILNTFNNYFSISLVGISGLIIIIFITFSLRKNEE
jgi:putative membrane protein